jgi:hypothetical protein
VSCGKRVAWSFGVSEAVIVCDCSFEYWCVLTWNTVFRYLAGGWNLKSLAEGKIATLTGQTIEVEVSDGARIKDVKKALEDKEGWRIEDLIIYTVAARKLDDTERLADLGISANTKNAALVVRKIHSDLCFGFPVSASKFFFPNTCATGNTYCVFFC